MYYYSDSNPAFNNAYLDRLVRELLDRRINYIGGDYDRWISVAYSLAGSEHGMEHFLALSHLDDCTVPDSEIRQKFEDVCQRSNTFNVGFFVNLCKQHDIDTNTLATEVFRSLGQQPRQATISIRQVLQPPPDPVLKEPAMLLDSQLIQDCYCPMYTTFCQSMVQLGFLTREQMELAASLYRIGACKNHNVIFWQIDEQQRLRDGKIMAYGSDGHRSKAPHAVDWVGHMLCRTHAINRANGQPYVPPDWQHTHCLFGLHLLAGQPPDRPVAIVESEKTAIICSQLLAHHPYLWMATGGIANINAQYLLPLGRQREIRFFPDLGGYETWQKKLDSLVQPLHRYFTIDTFLRDNADDQLRQMKADIADYLVTKQSQLHEMIDDNPLIGNVVNQFDLSS